MSVEEIDLGVKHLIKNDPYLAEIIKNSPVFKSSVKREHFREFVESILSQQLAGSAARAIIGRVHNLYENKISAQKIVDTPGQVLRDLGVSWPKIKYIKDLSEKYLSKEVHFRGIQHKDDQRLIEEFTVVKGIGEWTVQMYLIFNLGRLNVLPVKDLGVKKGAMLVYNLKKLPDEKKLLQLSKKYNWSPYNSLASWYLWKSLELKKKTLPVSL